MKFLPFLRPRQTKSELIKSLSAILGKEEYHEDEIQWGKIHVLIRLDPTTCMGQLLSIREAKEKVNGNYLVVFAGKKPSKWTEEKLFGLNIRYIISREAECIAQYIQTMEKISYA